MANANAESGPKGERHGWRKSIHFDFAPRKGTAKWISAFAGMTIL
jgi:hypothetical protein